MTLDYVDISARANQPYLLYSRFHGGYLYKNWRPIQWGLNADLIEVFSSRERARLYAETMGWFVQISLDSKRRIGPFSHRVYLVPNPA